jgi:hypothetical protein
MLDFLPTPPAIVVIAGGLFLFVLTVVQMLIGYRKIKFKGRTHMKVHKSLAWLLLIAGLGHGFAGILYSGILN